jgi:hypothetical protein
MRTTALALSLLVLGGCLRSPFEGTWLFLFDLESASTQGSCTDKADTSSSYGMDYDLIDIHVNDKGGIVVLMEMGLTGVRDGRGFTASGEEVRGYGDWLDSEGIDMDGSLAGGLLEGEVTSWWEYVSGDQVSDCATTWSYSAERIDTDPDEFSGEEL